MQAGSAIKLALGVAIVGAVGYSLYLIQKKISAAIPQVVKEGAEATGVLAEHAAHMLRDPLDAFGISPGYNARGVAVWERGLPWDSPVAYGDTEGSANSKDIVSNNSDGINFNLF